MYQTENERLPGRRPMRNFVRLIVLIDKWRTYPPPAALVLFGRKKRRKQKLVEDAI